MTTSEPFRAFDVVIEPFPYVDRLADKRRPALVISTAALARFGVDALLVAARLERFVAKRRPRDS